MRNYLLTPRNGYLIWGKIFREKITPTTLRQCLCQCGRNFSGVKPSQNDCQKILRKAISGPNASFSMSEFVVNTKTALEVVTTLLSESRFSEVEGLLTSECKAEVEKNVTALLPAQRLELAVTVQDIMYCFPYNLEVIKEGANGEKTFAQITVVHHACKNWSQVIQKSATQGIVEGPLDNTIYNARFIKEFTEGVDDQWTVNAINLWKLKEHLPYNQ